MPLKSPSALSCWAFGSSPKFTAFPSGVWAQNTLGSAYLSHVPSFLAKDSAAQANKTSGSVVCQGHVRESSYITPGRSDMSSHFVFLPWQWLKTLQQSCVSPYEACSLLYIYIYTQPTQHEGKSVLASICEVCLCQEWLKNWLVLVK